MGGAPPPEGHTVGMAVQLNHTIVAAHDAERSARWFATLFGVEAPEHFGHFWQITTANDVALDFSTEGDEIASQHYAFLVSEEEFDAIYGRVREQGIEHWADPQMKRPGQTNTEHGGRGVYFKDPSGHAIEMITKPYL